MKPNVRSKANRKIAKIVLHLPDLEFAKTAVLNSLTSPDAQRGYRHAIDEFVDWYCAEPRLASNRIVVLKYRSYLEGRQLASGTINLRPGAVRRLAYEAADCGLLKRRPCRRYSPGQRCPVAWRLPGELVHGRTGPCTLASTRQQEHEGHAGPGASCILPGMCSAKA
jgi:hypothetical protein